jgi:hypothetical protein
MPIDPMTGQDLPYPGDYSSSGIPGQVTGMTTRSQSSLFNDVLSSQPGLLGMFAANSRRGANTIMKGGFLDTNRDGRLFKRNDSLNRMVGSGSSRRATGLQASHMDGSIKSRLSRGSYVGSIGRRNAKMAKMTDALADTTGKLNASPPRIRPFMKNHLDPRALTRFHSVTALTGAKNAYSPFTGVNEIGNKLFSKEKYKNLVGGTAGDNTRMMGGGAFGMLRATSQTDALERKIAKRTASGKDTTRITKRLGKARQSISDIARSTTPGFDPFNMATTTVKDLQIAQVSGRTTPFQQASPTKKINPATGTTRFRNPKTGRFENRFKTQQPYFRSRMGTPVAPPGGIGPPAPGVTASSNAKIIRGSGGGYSAVLDDGSSRFISQDVGSKFFKDGVGSTGNALASSARGELTKRMLGYVRGAQGFAEAGNLSGQALAGARSAVNDAASLMSRMDAAGVEVRRSGGSKAAKIADIRSSRTAVHTTAQELLEMQSQVGAAGKNAGKTLTLDSFNARKKAAVKAGGPTQAFKTIADDILSVIPGAPGSASAAASTAVNTNMATGTGAKNFLTADVTEAVIGKKAGLMAGQEMLEQGLLKTYGVRGAAQIARYGGKEGAKLVGARVGVAALNFANPILTAAAVYDISKMAATAVIGGGARFARDAMKSMQGSINKPAFGMGYVDNEVAATSRARGVAAIQNSRLNARSALGSEAGMIASHFG